MIIINRQNSLCVSFQARTIKQKACLHQLPPRALLCIVPNAPKIIETFIRSVLLQSPSINPIFLFPLWFTLVNQFIFLCWLQKSLIYKLGSGDLFDVYPTSHHADLTQGHFILRDTHELRFMHGRRKKWLILSAFPIFGAPSNEQVLPGSGEGPLGLGG